MQEAIQKTMKSLLKPQIFLLLFVPLVISLVCWLFIFWFFWDTWIYGLTKLLQGTWLITTLQAWFSLDAGSFLSWMSALFTILLFLPITYLSSTLLTSIVAMPLILNRIAALDYRDLEKRKGGTLAGSIWNSVRVSLLYLVAIIFSLPLWLIPGCAILLPLIIGAWMNSKIFVYDSLQDFASKAEFQALQRSKAGSFFAMGVVLGVLNYLPFINFVSPVIMGVAYAHFSLTSLRECRHRASPQ